MIYSTENQENFTIYLSITSQDRDIANSFAKEQITPEKSQKIYYSTLAILVVNSYLQMLGFKTDSANSDSWNPLIRLCSNTADLIVTDLGKLECLAIEPGADHCFIPEEVRDLRIAYVVVEIDRNLHTGKILGFSPDVGTGILAVNNLRSPEDLIDILQDIRAENIQKKQINQVTLSKWFDHIFTTGWDTVESLINQNHLTTAFNFRSTKVIDSLKEEIQPTANKIIRARLLTLEPEAEKIPVVLLIKLQAISPTNININVQLYPGQKNFYLPESAKLTIIDEKQAEFMKAEARKKDNYIQLQFSGNVGETFTVVVSINNSYVEQYFTI